MFLQLCLPTPVTVPDSKSPQKEILPAVGEAAVDEVAVGEGVVDEIAVGEVESSEVVVDETIVGEFAFGDL